MLPARELAGSDPDVVLAELEIVFGFLYRRVGNRADAEDLVQDVAVKALPRLRSGAARESIRSYLFATARSALATFWGERLGHPAQELTGAETAMTAAWPAAGSDAEGEVERILARLPPAQRQVLELRFLRGYSIREGAAATGSTEGAVKLRQLRALRAAARLAGREPDQDALRWPPAAREAAAARSGSAPAPGT